MGWQAVSRERATVVTDRWLSRQTYTSDYVAIAITGTYPKTWYRAGFLAQVFDIDGLSGLEIRFGQQLGLGRKQVVAKAALADEYRLQFERADYLTKALRIEIWELVPDGNPSNPPTVEPTAFPIIFGAI